MRSALSQSDSEGGMVSERESTDGEVAAQGADGSTAVATQDRMEPPKFLPSPGFATWLDEVGGSLVLSTYQSARLIFLYAAEGRLHVLDRVVGTAMGLAVDQHKVWLGNKEQIWKFANTGPAIVNGQAVDALYMPRKGYFIGPCDTHDLIADAEFKGERYELVFANTNFSCIAALDDQFNFRPLWKPDFISSVAAEDRCHLNGIGARDGRVVYATLCGRYDTTFGWRDAKNGGGFAVDVETGEILAQGLSMPHSPRWYRDRLWLLNSGGGQFGYVDGDRGGFVAVAECPGFARGLSFVGDYAIIGLSQLRANSFASGIALNAKLQAGNIQQRCGLQIVDLRTGRNAHWLTISGPVTELYDVAFNASVRRPYCPGFREPELHRQRVQLPDNSFPHPYRGMQRLVTQAPGTSEKSQV
ncbi:TIGR03032 family protein [Nitrospirillum sp. BR 11163]|uniref:TIGR03032 family protein n=1 Tax=Nitrospirillum sp. BR 11163 TaxID=3104323 RepID=UPI002AFE3081|nr:TIGR03032 family protein [Nitrospirillum sp. BR 11163]MEA1673345.1 TIGR03032 family protein [Nitrospirillum sp. BR 11163]